MKPLITTIALLFFSLNFAFCQDTTFTQKDFDSAKVYYKVDKIPLDVKNKVAEIEGRWHKMANKDGKWEASDAISDTSLPRRVLICFVVMPTRYILLYEQGGFGTYYKGYLFLVKKGKLAAYNLGVPCDTYKDLKQYLLNNKRKFTEAGENSKANYLLLPH